ncbi:MAG: phosphotransferase family protein [Solirubrobacterales bacterium]
MDEGAAIGLDRARTACWLGEAAGLRGPVSFQRIGRGQSNLTFLATDADRRRVVLRRPPLGELLASAHDIAREHRILRALQPTAVATPDVVGFTDDPAITDVPLLAVEHVEGLVVDDLAIAEALPPEVRERLGGALVSALASIHAVDLNATGLVDLASHKPYAERQIKRWRRQWERSRTRDLPTVADLAGRLEAAMPKQRQLTLVHGDFHLLNTIASPGGDTIRAVLDWELCTLGDPLADLGGLLAYWPQAGDEGTPLFAAPALPGFMSRDKLAEAYAERTGHDIADLPFWHVLGLWKVAIIGEGVRRRALEDPRNAPDVGVPSQDAVDDLVAHAMRVASAAGF